MTKKKRTVSLVLGSGGARGLAHIGIIRWLEEHDYEIQAISGSSMGALIGGIYAAGKLDIYTKWVKALNKRDVIRLLDFSFGSAGIFSGDRVIQTLRDLLGDTEIESLPISFTAVTTDLDEGKEIWLNEGSLFDAIRASISIPTVFTPVRYKGHLLVDGGLLNPVPIAPTVYDVTDITVAVDLLGKREKLDDWPVPDEKENNNKTYQEAIREFIENFQEKFLPDDPDKEQLEKGMNIVEIVNRSYDAMQSTITRFKMAAYNPDIVISIPANACSTFDFHRAEAMIELGYERAARYLAQA
ncbi:MAG: patatin-like phospholipase family protein [Proteobacteria bacterium]|jgi:NTE family protein|nr:patatin-like phospholipase family protein [Pseudomonadota bacterium]